MRPRCALSAARIQARSTIFTIQAISPEGKSSSTTVSITIIAEFHYQPSTLIAKVKQPISPMIPSENFIHILLILLYQLD